MTTLKHLSISFLAGWLTAWFVLFAAILLADSLSGSSYSRGEVATGLVRCLAYTFPVVLLAWLVVATPYHLCCIRKNRPNTKFVHLIVTPAIAAGLVGMVLEFQWDEWLIIGIPASLSAFVGTWTLLRLHQTTPTP